MMKYLYPVFWFFAGSDQTILKDCPRVEQNKHFGLGATILITAVFAILSGTYAIQTLVENKQTALFIGLFWGFVIFNLDRLMIATMKKSTTNNKWQELWKALPRILLAIVIAVVVSKPIEVKILENQIDKQLAYDFAIESLSLQEKSRDASGIDQVKDQIYNSDEKLDNLTGEEQQISQEAPYIQATQNYDNCKREQESGRKRIENLRRELATVNSSNPKYRIKINIYTDSTGKEYKHTQPSGIKTVFKETQYGLSKSGVNEQKRINNLITQVRQSIPSCNNYIAERKQYLEDRKLEIAEQKTAIKARQQLAVQKEAELIAQLDTAKAKNDAVVEKAGTDIFGKLIALENAKTQMSAAIDSTGTGGDAITINMQTEQSMMYYISWAIMIFFFILETCPVLVKIMADRGPYDEILATQEIGIREQQRLKQSEVVEASRHEIESMRETQDHIRHTELDTNDELMRQISSARIDIAKKVVEKWKEKELNELSTNPEEYLEKSIK